MPDTEWAFVAPDGTEYRFLSLAKFVREHAALFVGLHRATVIRGLGELRAGMPSARWHGWRWIGSTTPTPQYALRSPDGTEHHFDNMALFIREHGELFEAEDVRAYNPTGLTRAAIGLGALRPRPTSRYASWKGWRWLRK